MTNFDLANILLLDLGGMGEGILEILACLPLDALFRVIFLIDALLNYTEIHCLKDLLFLLAVNLF